MKGDVLHIFRVQRYSIHDGPGIRTTLFFQGCPLACSWCHNPESQAMVDIGGDRGKRWGSEREVNSTQTLVRELTQEIEKDLIFYDESGGGVTFSGGEPLCRPELLMSLARACREKGIHTCLDTSGAAPWSVLEKVARTMDLILYDIKAVDPGMHRRLTGISSKEILENLENLNQSGARVSLRFPFIPGYTDTRENIQEILEFLTLRTGYRTIHLLPFHHTAKGKYEALGRKDPMAGVEPPANEAVAEAAALFQARGFKTIIGG